MYPREIQGLGASGKPRDCFLQVSETFSWACSDRERYVAFVYLACDVASRARCVGTAQPRGRRAVEMSRAGAWSAHGGDIAAFRPGKGEAVERGRAFRSPLAGRGRAGQEAYGAREGASKLPRGACRGFFHATCSGGSSAYRDMRRRIDRAASYARRKSELCCGGKSGRTVMRPTEEWSVCIVWRSWLCRMRVWLC
jgi:hypothetical protein